MHSYPSAERIQSSSVIINPHIVNRACGRWSELSGWLTSYPENLRICVEAHGWVFRIWSKQINFGLDRQRSVEIVDTTRCTVCRGVQYNMVSIGFYDLRLPPYVIKDWRLKEINSFVQPVFLLLLLLLILSWLYNIRTPPHEATFWPWVATFNVWGWDLGGWPSLTRRLSSHVTSIPPLLLYE